MQNVLYRLSETPGAIRWSGRQLGHDTIEVLQECGISQSQIEELMSEKIISGSDK
jgi:crotonobetainyl-CoA:carnitine CoA-transferase CaiB-like acyl-CoA transferase